MANCKHCRKKFIQKNINYRYCDEPECKEAGTDFKIAKALEKARKNLENAKKEKFDKMKENIKTLSQYEAEAKKYFQLFVRLRDSKLPCISCGSKTDEVDGGHFFKAELYSGLIFDERNCHSQCRKCNRFQGGAQAEYRMGLVDRYGEDFVKILEQDSIRLRNYKFTKDQLIELKEHYKQLSNNLKK